MKGQSTAAQISAIYTLLAKAGLRDEKESIVLSFTAGRTGSVTHMAKEEAAALISHLKSLDVSLNRFEKAANRMRGKIMGLAHEMGWRVEGTRRIDMHRLNNWCLSRSYLKKKLDAYTYDELPRLVTQFEQVYKSYLKGL